MLLLIVLLGLIFFVLLIAYWKLNPFIAFIIVAVLIGLAAGMSGNSIADAIQQGIGNTLGSLVIILGFGAMLGKIFAESGAAGKIADSLVHVFGPRYVQWGVVLAGFVVGLPLFFSIGFVILVPLIFVLANTSQRPVMFLGLPLLAALSITHGLLPPHPAPTAIAGTLEAEMGKVLVYGVIVGIPAILLGGPLFARFARSVESHPLPVFYPSHDREVDVSPSLINSLVNALLPVILLSLPTFFSHDASILGRVISFVGNPVMAMLISVLFSIYWLGLRQGQSMTQVMKHCLQAVEGIAMILLIIGGAGALKQVMIASGVSPLIAGLLEGVDVSPLILAWLIAAVIRIAVGSATVAAMTTVGVIQPLIQTSGVDPNLMVLSIGAGSLFFSHLNDGGFWLVKEYFNLSIKETLKTWSILEVIVSVAGLLGVLILSTLI